MSHDSLRNLLRNHLVAKLEDAIDDEWLFKEVFEACESEEDAQVVDAEIREMISLVRSRP